MNLTTLALLVLVRTALGWALTLEVEGRWPWQEKKEAVREPWPASIAAEVVERIDSPLVCLTQ